MHWSKRVVTASCFAAILVTVSLNRSFAESKPVNEPRRDLYGDPLPEYAVARMGTVRCRPMEQVWAIAVSPDGKTIATGTIPGSMHDAVELWDAASGRKTGTLALKGYNLIGLAWSPDGRELAVAHSRKVKIWNPRAREPVRVLKGEAADEKKSFWSVDWSPDGQRIAATKPDLHRVYVWDAKTGKIEKAWDFPASEPDGPDGLAFSPDGHSLAVGGQKLLRVYDLEDFKIRLDVPVPGTVWSLDFSSDGKTLAGGVQSAKRQCRMFRWDLQTGRKLAVSAAWHGSGPQVVFCEAGKKIAASGWGGTLRFWDAATNELLTSHKEPGCVGPYLSASADGNTLATANRRIAIWEPARQRQRLRWETHGTHVFSVLFGPDEKTVVSGSGDGTVRYWRLSDGRQLRKLDAGRESVTSLALASDGKTMASSGTGGAVRLWNVGSGDLLATLVDSARGDQEESNSYPAFNALQFLPDGRTLVSGGGDRFERHWDVPTRRLVRRVDRGRPIGRVEYSANGKFLAWGALDGPIHLCSVQDGQELRVIRDSFFFFGAFAFSPDGRTIATQCAAPLLSDESESMGQLKLPDVIRVWDCATGKLVWSTERIASVLCISFSVDGRLLASSSIGTNEPIRLWSAATGQQLMELRGHSGNVRGLAFSRDGSRLVSASQDATLLVWNINQAWKKLEDKKSD